MRTVTFEIRYIVLICVATIASCHRECTSISPITKLVIDTDGAVDDIISVVMALEAERLDNGPKIVAITCLGGLNSLDNAVINVLKTLKALHRTDIPVYAGAAGPLVTSILTNYTYYGNDNFGDFDFPDPPSADLVRKTHAVNALIALVRKYKGKLTVVSIAPPTNIALAIRMFPEFLDYLQQLIIMGGSVEGRGNVRPGVDYNSLVDPTANYIVFSSVTSKPVHFVYLEATTRARIPMSLRLRLNECGNVKSWLIKNGERLALDPQEKYWYCPDAVGVIVAITSGSIVTKSHPYYMDAIYEGTKTQGMTLVDYTNITGNPANTNLIQNIKTAVYARSLLRWFGCESGGD